MSVGLVSEEPPIIVRFARCFGGVDPGDVLRGVDIGRDPVGRLMRALGLACATRTYATNQAA